MASTKMTKDAFITRWVVIYSRGKHWHTAHFGNRTRARREVRFLKHDCTDRQCIENVQLHQIHLWPRKNIRNVYHRC